MCCAVIECCMHTHKQNPISYDKPKMFIEACPYIGTCILKILILVFHIVLQIYFVLYLRIKCPENSKAKNASPSFNPERSFDKIESFTCCRIHVALVSFEHTQLSLISIYNYYWQLETKIYINAFDRFYCILFNDIWII